MSRERDNEEVPTNVGALVLKGILIGAGIGIAAIGSALLGYGIYRELTKEEVDRIPVTCLRNRNEAGMTYNFYTSFSDFLLNLFTGLLIRK